MWLDADYWHFKDSWVSVGFYFTESISGALRTEPTVVPS